MDGYDRSTYGDAFADVYDEWYADVSDVAATVADLIELAGPGPVLELGVGTGRIAVPLAEAGLATGIEVVGLDSSAAMLARLAWRDPAGLVTEVLGDMAGELPPGPFTLVFAAYNTLFNLTGEGQQAACFAAAASRLAPGGRFVIEVFVPDPPDAPGEAIRVRSLTVDRVVLSISVDQPDRQMAEGQFVEITESGGVRLRPWSVRYSTPEQLDAHADAAGFELESRWESFGGVEFHADSPRHVSVYRLRS
jgi:SAM-dependent methyltransferase